MEIKFKNTAVKLLKDKKRNETLIIFMPEYYWYKHLSMKNFSSYKMKGTDVLLISYIKRKFNINKLAKEIKKIVIKMNYKYKKIILVGKSKGGVVLQHLLKKLDERYYKKAIAITVPYKGTVFANPKEMQRVLKRKGRMGRILFKNYIKIYDGGKPDIMIRKDSKELQEINKNIIVNKKFENFILKCNLKNLILDLLRLDFESSFLFILDKYLGVNGDGIVGMRSQMIKNRKVKNNFLNGTHKSAYRKVMKIVLRDT